jgi:hypothetical protein
VVVHIFFGSVGEEERQLAMGKAGINNYQDSSSRRRCRRRNHHAAADAALPPSTVFVV